MCGNYTERRRGQRKERKDDFPKYKLYLNLQKIPFPDETSDEKHYQFKFIEVKNAEKNWFPVCDIVERKNKEDAVKYAEKHYEIKDNKMRSCVEKLFEIVHEKRLINFYLEDTKSIEKALKIFIRVNKGGTILDYSDLLLSFVIAEWNDKNQGIRADILDFVDEINDKGKHRGESFRFSKDFVLKTGLVLTKNHPKFNVDNFKKANIIKIENNWDKIKKSISSAVDILVRLGFDGKTLTSNNAVIPVAHYYFLTNNFNIDSNSKDAESIKKYITRALIKRVFGSSSDTTLEQIRIKIEENKNKKFPFEELAKKLNLQFTHTDINDLLDIQYKNNLSFVLLAILQKNKFPPSGIIHKDHFFPQKFFGNEISDTENKNKLANLVLLVDILNKEKSKKNPYDWINEHWEKNEDEKKRWMEDCYIPSDSSAMRDFDKFYKKREKILKKKLMKILEVSKGDALL